MTALRIMTFNVQLLPLAAVIAAAQSDEAVERAERAAEAIRGMPPDEQPDVIAFNEVFSEDGRNTLKSWLVGRWPHFIEKLPGPGPREDAGVMLFSRFPFRALPTGDFLYERYYQDSAGDDAMANKAVGIVQIDEPLARTTIAFTHLQASYDYEDQHSEVRASQLDEIQSALETVLAGDPGDRGRVIVMGDLNVRGDNRATAGERGILFEQGGTTLCGPYIDGWRTYIQSPQGDRLDQGITNVDYKDPELRQRLDYMFFCRRDAAETVLVPQQMRVRLRNSSDHFALEAVVNEYTPHCVPSEAIDFLAVQPKSGGQDGLPTSLRTRDLSFDFDGTYQWLFVDTPGTYSLFSSANVTFEVYQLSDMSHPVQRVEVLDRRLLPTDLKNAFVEHRFEMKGDTFACREPFLVLTKTVDGRKGSGEIGMIEHRGESDVTAIELLLHQDVESSFPPNQILGDEDQCWFRAHMPRTLQGITRNETFLIYNPSGGTITVSIVNDDLQPTSAAVSGSDEYLLLEAPFKGGETVYLTIERDSQDLTGFWVKWNCPLSFIDLNEPIFFYINDESGFDVPGADTPELQVNVDTGLPVYAGRWPDADTGEHWPGLAEAIRKEIGWRLPGVMRVGFVEGIFLTYIEPDFNAHGYEFEFIAPLPPSEVGVAIRTISMPVPDALFDGRYSFTCTITRFP